MSDFHNATHNRCLSKQTTSKLKYTEIYIITDGRIENRVVQTSVSSRFRLGPRQSRAITVLSLYFDRSLTPRQIVKRPALTYCDQTWYKGRVYRDLSWDCVSGPKNHGQGEEECAKTYTGAHASEECCNKGCMWGSCLSMVWNTKPVYHYGCHAIGWNGTKDCLEGKIPDIICPTEATKPVVGSFCTFNHGECNDITGAFCNTTENTATDITKALCECAAIYQPGKKGDVKCIARDCTDDKFCVDLDKGSKCHNGTCACKEGLAIDSSTKTSTCSQRPDPTTTPAADTCSEVGGKDECCGKALCKFVECTDKTNSTSTITVCYELDSTMTAKCEEEAPDNKCRATNITTTLGPTDPCQAQSNQTACCGQTDDKCVFISCTGLDDQPHTGCHKNSTDYPAFCKDAATDMCKYGYETESIGEFQRNMKNALKYLNENMKGLQSGQEALVSRIEALEGGMTKMDRTVFGQGPDKGKKGRGNIQSDIDRLKKENRLMRKKTKALEKAVKVMMSLNKQKGA